MPQKMYLRFSLKVTLSEFVIRQLLYTDDVFTFFLLPIYVESDLLASCYEYKNLLVPSMPVTSPQPKWPLDHHSK